MRRLEGRLLRSRAQLRRNDEVVVPFLGSGAWISPRAA
jgi:hypothetical protein